MRHKRGYFYNFHINQKHDSSFKIIIRKISEFLPRDFSNSSERFWEMLREISEIHPKDFKKNRTKEISKKKQSAKKANCHYYTLRSQIHSSYCQEKKEQREEILLVFHQCTESETFRNFAQPYRDVFPLGLFDIRQRRL